MNRTKQTIQPIGLVRRLHQAAPGNIPPAVSQLSPVTISDSSRIHRILVPVDAIHTALSDFCPILVMARRFGATVTLLHSYVAPPSFDFAVGDAALQEVSLHCQRVRTRLYELARDAREIYFNCIGRFALGYPSVQILRQSRELKADLIAVPLPLDLISWCWLPEELLDELVRKADCPVLCVPASQRPVGQGISHFSKPVGTQSELSRRPSPQRFA